MQTQMLLLESNIKKTIMKSSGELDLVQVLFEKIKNNGLFIQLMCNIISCKNYDQVFELIYDFVTAQDEDIIKIQCEFIEHTKSSNNYNLAFISEPREGINTITTLYTFPIHRFRYVAFDDLIFMLAVYDFTFLFYAYCIAFDDD